MLSESFIASFLTSKNQSATTTSSSAPPKDAGICVTEFQSSSFGSGSGSRSGPATGSSAGGTVLKNSSTDCNCLGVSSEHVFAAQAGKAVLHVYSRERGNQEATVPFPERIRSLAVTGNGEEGVGDGGLSNVVLGTEQGKLIVWEPFSGRQVSTPASHLQPITSLIIDSTNNFVLSGSEDANIHVWSLPALLSFSPKTPVSNPHDPSPSNFPLRTLSNHSAAITTLAVGHSANRGNIAVSCSRDSTAIIWEYRTGKLLRIYLLPFPGISLALDPADRAVYIGYEDGSIQQIDFFKSNSTSVQNTLHDASQQNTPSQISPNDRWCPPPSSELGAAQCLTLSYDGMTLLSGHKNGTVARWDVAKGRYAGAVSNFAWSVTNLRMLPPRGLRQGPDTDTNSTRKTSKKSRIAVHNIVKPRLDHALSDASATGIVPASYTLHVHITSSSPFHPSSEHTHPTAREPSPMTKFSDAMTHPSFPSSLIADGLMELTTHRTTPTGQSSQQAARSAPEQTDASTAGQVMPAPEEATKISELQTELSIQQSARRTNVAEILKLRNRVAALEAANSDLLDEKEELLRSQARGKSSKNSEEDEDWNAKRMRTYHEAEAKGLNGNAALRKLERISKSAGPGEAGGESESQKMDSDDG